MRYVLVRHGETLQNVGDGLNIIDQLVGFTEKGKMQTSFSANKIQLYLEKLDTKKVGIFYSPYYRTQLMAKVIREKYMYADYIEEALISEIQCGDFTGYTMTQYKDIRPDEYNKYKQYKNSGCRFWYRFRDGESPFDVNVRANMFLAKIKDYDYDTVVIISHAHFLHVLEMNLLKESIAWYEQNDGFDNSEIHFINNNSIENVQKYESAD